MNNFLAYNGLLIFCLALFISLFVFRPNKLTNIIWSLLSFFISLWGFGVFFAFRTADSFSFLFWSRFLNLIALFIPCFFLHFVFSFLNIKKTITIFVIYIFVLSYFIFNLIFPEYFVRGVTPKAAFIFYPNAGRYYFIFPLYYLIFLLIGAGLLFKAFQTAEGRLKIQIRNLFWAMAIGFSGGSTTFPLLYNIPIYPVGVIGIIALVFIVAFTITKQELFDIRVAISRTLAYSTSIFIIFVLSLSIIYLNFIFLQNSLISLFIVVPILTLLSVIIFQPIRSFIQTSAEEKWISDYYNTDAVIEQISKNLSSAVFKEQVFAIVANDLQNSIKLKNTSIILSVEDKNLAKVQKYKLYSPNQKKAFYKEITFSKNHALIKYFSKETLPLAYKKLPEEIKKKIGSYGFDKYGLFFPIYFDKKLEGIIFFGQKLSENAFDKKDINLLKMILARQIESSLRNLVLQKDLQQTRIEKAYADEREQNIKRLNRSIIHELKNTSLGIETTVEEIIKHDKKISTDSKEALTDIQLQISRLFNFSKNYLYSEMAKAGMLKINKQEVNLSELIQNAIKANHHLIKARELTLQLKIPENAIINADLALMHTCVSNIINNAAKYSHNGGVIKIGYDEKKRALAIKDHGPGIEKEVLSKIYEDFAKSDKQSTQHSTGLGLGICRMIMELHGGEILVENEIGDGTKVFFML